MKPNILIILGPTAVGKSSLAVELAQRFNGEVISADSRQVYTGLNIGTGKITQEEMKGIPHHLLDVADPQTVFTVAEWKNLAEQAIEDIIARGKLPIICGGTGFYIQSIVDNMLYPEVPPNEELRVKLETKTPEALYQILQELDPLRAKDIDQYNPVRLIRAIEIAKALGSVPSLQKEESKYTCTQIGITLPEQTLKEHIHTRLISRLDEGMIREAETLHAEGLSFERMHRLGLEYGYLACYLQKEISYEDMRTGLEKDIWQYAKRQMTWFKKDTRIQWFDLSKEDSSRDLDRLILEVLK